MKIQAKRKSVVYKYPLNLGAELFKCEKDRGHDAPW